MKLKECKFCGRIIEVVGEWFCSLDCEQDYAFETDQGEYADLDDNDYVDKEHEEDDK